MHQLYIHIYITSIRSWKSGRNIAFFTKETSRPSWSGVFRASMELCINIDADTGFQFKHKGKVDQLPYTVEV